MDRTNPAIISIAFQRQSDISIVRSYLCKLIVRYQNSTTRSRNPRGHGRINDAETDTSITFQARIKAKLVEMCPGWAVRDEESKSSGTVPS